MTSVQLQTGEAVQIYSVHDFPYKDISVYFKRRTPRSKHKYRMEFGTFDIETTSHIDSIDEDGLHGYGYMYIWQFCTAGYVCMGRTWEDFILLLQKINQHFKVSAAPATYVIYVHNLAFEFAFASGILTQAGYQYEVFATRNRKVLTWRIPDLQIEFRCSAKLTNRSLKKLLKDNPETGLEKMVGDLDYRVERTPKSKLSDAETGYCVVDVLGLYRAIKCEMQRSGDCIATIPLTSTGYVRRALRERTDNNRSYRNLVAEMVLDVKQYSLVRRLCKGGDTLASMSQPIGTVLHEGDSFDYKSSYPAQLTTQRYPIGKLRAEYHVTMATIEKIEADGDYYITEVLVYNVRLKSSIQPIPCISCYKADYISDDHIEYNGRLLAAEVVCIAFDMPSFQLFRKQYDFDTIQFGETYSCLYDYLPQVFRDFVIDTFKQKCLLEYDLKEREHTIEEKQDIQQNYNLFKNRLNGIFGMAYTNPLHNDFVYDPESYTWTEPGALDLASEETAQKLYKSQITAVAPYLWGVHTASLGRVALDRLIDTVGWENTWYCDTDSNKCRYDPEIRERVDKLNEELKALAVRMGAFVTVEDKTYYLGVVECETESETMSEFITQGAKKYCYRLSDGLHMTLSGVEKAQVVQLHDDIMNFKKGMIFDPAGGITLHYFDEAPHVQHVKGDDGTECDIWLSSNIVATDRIITLGSIVDQRLLLEDKQSGVDADIDELYQMSLLIPGEEIDMT